MEFFMKLFVNRTKRLFVVPAAFFVGLAVLLTTLGFNAKSWAVHPANLTLYKNGQMTYFGDITDITGKMLVYTEGDTRKWNSDANIRKATLHAVGDFDGFIKTGAQTAFRAQLAGYNPVNGTYGAGNNIMLTIDAQICTVALSALGSRFGAVGVINYKTGDILCNVSTPTYDPQSPPSNLSDENKYKGVYVNRLFSGKYAPGSVFKLVTTAAALENIKDIFDHKYSCHYGVDIKGKTVSCLGNHKSVEIKEALKESCNAAFAQITLEVGRSKMKSFTNKIGFGKTYSVDGIKLDACNYDISNAKEDVDFGWSGVGQFDDIINPLNYLMYVASIANGGVQKPAHIIKSIQTPSGIPQSIRTGLSTRTMSSKTAGNIKEMMRSNVKEKYGESSFPGLNLCAKTGTAETIEGTIDHSLFVGFMDDPQRPYAFIVVAEHSGAGANVAAHVANTVLQEVKKKY